MFSSAKLVGAEIVAAVVVFGSLLTNPRTVAVVAAQ
jgi:hypothetical protein